LTLLDVYTREALAVAVDQGIKAEQVVAVLDAVVAIRGAS
jgi:putative transposase